MLNVRTRMVGQGGPSNCPELTKAQYKSLTDAFVRMVRVEGPSSLFQVIHDLSTLYFMHEEKRCLHFLL